MIISLLRTVLLALAGAGVLAQFGLWSVSLGHATAYPEVAAARVAIFVLAALVVACGQVVLFCVWKLLGLVESRALFEAGGGADGWVNAAIAALLVAPVLIVAVPTILLIGYAAGPPGLLLAAAVGALGSLGAALVVVVMRRLLHEAIADRSELAEVV